MFHQFKPNKNKLYHILLIIALLVGLGSKPLPTRAAPSTTFVVNTTADTDDANKGDTFCADGSGNCSLRAAISEANALGGTHTITLPANTYTLTIAGAGEENNTTGDLDIRSTITINGASAGSTIIQAGTDTSNGIDRLFQVVYSDHELTLNDVTVRYGKESEAGGGIYNSYGKVNLNSSILSSNSGPNGGGIYNSDGTVNLNNSVLSENSGSYGGGIYNNSGTVNLNNSVLSGNSGSSGGGIYNSDGTVNLNNSVFSGNSSGSDGGGIFNSYGTLNVDESTITGNSATYDGGGVYNYQTVTINNSTLSNNSARSGGGVYNTAGTATLKNSTITGNSATVNGAGFDNENTSTTLNLAHCTITNNHADNYAGGIFRSTGTVNFKNTIIAGNTSTGGGVNDCYNSPTSQGYNLVGSGTGCPNDGTGDQITSNPLLNALADNGGSTQTHALQSASPARNAIPNGTNGCGSSYTEDQRGVPRPIGGSCDIGAYEAGGAIWDNGGGNSNWSTAANWSEDAAPTTSNVLVFNNTSDANATMDAAYTVAGVLIDSDYDGDINSGSYNLTVNGPYGQSGGSFTAPYSLMTVSGGFHHTGGTFSPNGGRVVLDNASDQSLATTFHDLVINDGLLGYWKLDEGSGTTAADSSGYGHSGTLENGPTWSTDTPATMDFHDPYSISFDGVDDQVAIGDDFVRPISAFTYSLWFQPTSDWNSSSSGESLLSGKTGERPAIIFNWASDGKIALLMQVGGSSQIAYTTTSAWSAGTWYHLAFTWNGSQVIVYVNGIQEGTPLGVSGTHDASSGMYIGGLDGRMDDVRVYNRALSAVEISDLANGKHPQTSIATTILGAALDVNGDLTLNSGTLDVKLPTLGYWKLDDGSGTSATDSSGNGHSGTLINMENSDWVTNTAPTHFSNLYALQFDGVDEYVDIPINVSETAYALSLWFKTSCADCGIFSVDDGYLGSNGYDRDIYLEGGVVCARIWLEEKICTDGIGYADGIWHQLVHTYGGTMGGQKLYLDGVLQASGTKAASDFNWQSGVNIGFSKTASYYYFEGLIDDVRIYDQALSAEQVQALADGYEASPDINLAGNFTRNGGVFTSETGSVTFDGSGTQTLDTDAITFYNLTINSGSKLVDAAEFAVSDTLTNNGSLQRTKNVDGVTEVYFFDTGGYGGVAISEANLGNTTVIIRGTQDCTTIPGETVQRCFDIAPANHVAAKVKFYFTASELSGNDCNALNVYRWTGAAWQQMTLDSSWGGDGRSCEAEPYSVQANVTDFSFFALKSGDPPEGSALVPYILYLPLIRR